MSEAGATTERRARGAEGYVLRCERLSKRFGDVQAVDDVGFRISEGETYGLLGPNGAGKTTTISMVCGLLERDAGEVYVEGETLTTRSVDAKRHIGYVPQEIAVYPDLTARENLRFFGRLYGIDRSDLDARIDEVLGIIGLTERAGDRTDEYSGGMKRRLNIGLGLLHSPRLLVLDEPTVGVDPQSRNAILESVERLSVEGMAVLYTTHYMEEAERLCDRVGIIDEGELVAEGARRELVGMVGQHDRVHLTADGDLEAAARAAQAMGCVREAGVVEHGIDVLVDDAAAHLAGLLSAIAGQGITVRSVDVDEPDLEAVFLHLTGKALRD